MCEATVEQRQEMLGHPLLKKPIPSEDPAVLESLKTEAYERFERHADKTETKKRKDQDAILQPGSQQPAKKRKAIKGHKNRWVEAGQNVDHPTPGVALVACEKSRASAILGRVGFQVVGLGSDPQGGVASFMRSANKMSRLRHVTHLVLCSGFLAAENPGCSILFLSFLVLTPVLLLEFP